MNFIQGRIHGLAGCLALLICCSSTISGQGLPKARTFRLPDNARSTDYGHGYVLVKLKEEHRNLFQHIGGRSSVGTPATVGMTGARKIVSEKLLTQGRAQKGPLRSKTSIDMSLYYEVACETGRDIEDFINELYQTDYFDLVEPDYANRMVYSPNDPAKTSQYYLQNIRAYEAWDVTQGDESVTIAIVDSGGDLVHEDLVDNMYTNPLDPIDGVDNDNNGYIDDFRGWDFMGADTLSINDPNFLGDNNPQLISTGLSHGVSVAGCAGARADNGKGIAGVGFKTKIMFTKHTADNQKPTTGSIFRGYSGVLYAASRGADIINLSWGGQFRSEIVQDLINYVTLDLGSLVVAAAGNNGLEIPFYPAAYDNVLAVSAVNQQNSRASFSNFGSYVDIAAPGVGIFTTTLSNAYTSIQGTSFSSPIVAGAAALVKAHFPAYTPQQIAEQLRVTSNSTALNNNNPSFVGKMGKGVLDIYAALTQTSPALRASNPALLNTNGSPAEPGEKGFLTLSFKNVLAVTSSAVEISISENSPYIDIVKGSIKPGVIPAGGTITNKLTPFEIQIAAVVPENFLMPLTVSYKDGAYNDQEVVTFLLNPTFIDIDENLVTTTVSGTGRLGFEDPQNSTRTKGVGFVFDQNSLLYEMGIMMGTGTGSQLFNNVRGSGTTFDLDFVSIGTKIKEITPGVRSQSEIFGTLSNSTTPASQAFQLKYRSLAWKEAPYDKFVILEYIISNPTATAITNFHFGIFADWDITANGAEDAAKWENPLKLGYVYPALTAALPHAGIKLLTGPAEYYAIDNDQNIAGGASFGLYDGFTDAEKFQSISTGLGRLEAGTSGAGGNDVSHVVGTGPYTIPAGQEIKIAFALLAAPNFEDLKLTAKYADSVYNFTLNAPVPSVAEVATCYETPASITATGAADFKWYKSFTGGTSFFTGSTYNTGNLFNDTTFYVSNADNSYESIRGLAKVVVKANPTVFTSGSPTICSNESIILSVGDADTYLWSTGEATKTIQVSQAGSYTVTVNSTIPICQNTSVPLVVDINPAPVADFEISTGGELKAREPIQFSDLSTGAVSWLWDFGDGHTSTEANPANTFINVQSYDVKLTVTSDKGCQNNTIMSIGIITGIENAPEVQPANAYPNPFKSILVVTLNPPYHGPVSIHVVDIQGRLVYSVEASSASSFEIPGADLPDGIYVVRVSDSQGVFNKKILKIH